MSDAPLRHRLAAILAADAAGYSRLMAADERGTLDALDAARAVFRERTGANAGRVVDTAGDSVLAIFETATGAVTAALEIQRSLDEFGRDAPADRRLRFRIGVYMGDVAEKPDGTVYGDGVNIAARLQALAEPGGVVVSDAVRRSVKGHVAASFADLGSHTVKNIDEPIRAFAAKPEAAAPATPHPAAGETDPPLPDRPSIAVLPFTNMSGDPEQEYFTDGITEDIITELSRFHSIFVIARNSTFTYKGKPVDVRAVAKELGVRYVLEGSIRRAANRVRVTAQLIDSRSGNHIWAERYDRVLEDVFAIQEEVTQSIVTAIAPTINAAERERARRRRPDNLSAYEIAVRAMSDVWDAFEKADRDLRARALGEARAALAIDPRSVLALNAIAAAQFHETWLGTAADREAAARDGLAAASTAIEVDPLDSQGHVWKGLLLSVAPGPIRWDEALASLNIAHELNVNDVGALIPLAWTESLAGNAERGIEHARKALRISPRDPLRYMINTSLALAHLLLGNYAASVEHALASESEAPRFPWTRAFAAASRVGLGDLAEAARELEEARRLAPEWVRTRLEGQGTFRRERDWRRFTTFLRVAAGLEDPGAADALR